MAMMHADSVHAIAVRKGLQISILTASSVIETGSHLPMGPERVTMSGRTKHRVNET